MTILTETIGVVIGVDTHRDTHTAAVIEPRTGAVLGERTAPTTAEGYQDLIEFARSYGRVQRWSIEGTCTYGTDFTRVLIAAGETVGEIDRPKRPPRRGGKSDSIDAIRAGREALAVSRLAIPRQGCQRDAIATSLIVRRSAVEAVVKAQTQLKALIVTSPDELRAQVRGRSDTYMLQACRDLVAVDGADIETVTRVNALVGLATRIALLNKEADMWEQQLRRLIMQWRPELLDRVGVGPISAAHLLCAWSHPGRFRSEAAFAMLAGAAPIPASSGQTVRYRMNRRGDRQLNQTLHTIAMTRMRYDDNTKAYVQRRLSEGKQPREIRRCLKRYIARELFRLMENQPG